MLSSCSIGNQLRGRERERKREKKPEWGIKSKERQTERGRWSEVKEERKEKEELEVWRLLMTSNA